MAIPLTLKVFKGDALTTSKEYERDIIKIGRLASAHLCLDDDKVSRIHSVIDATEGKLSITDMGSMEGTYVNGKRVNKSPLSFGDEIRVGNTRIMVEQRAGATNGLPAVRQTEPTEQTQQVAAAAVAAQPVTAPVNLPAAAPAPVQVAAPAPAPAVNGHAAPPPPPPPENVVMTPAKAARPPSAAVAATPIKPTRPRTDTSGNVGLQIRFVWGDQILAVHQFEKPADFMVGTTPKSGFVLEADKLGSNEFQLLKGGGQDFVRPRAEPRHRRARRRLWPGAVEGQPPPLER